MTELESLRRNIENIDGQMAVLFEKRMKTVEEILKIKEAEGRPVRDSNREQQLLEKYLDKVSEPWRSSYTEFMETVLKLSRQYQEQHRGSREKGN